MSDIAERFQKCRAQKRCGFIPFIVAGDSSLQLSARLLRELSELDPVAIELGVPFSDPTADGPVIQRASQRALSRDTSLARVLTMIRDIGSDTLAPVVLFTYYNPILRFGIDAFVRAAAASGIAAVLAVDLPAEAAVSLHAALHKRNIDLIFLVAPTTSDLRLGQIARSGSGFIYAVSRTGITGAAPGLLDESQELVGRIRSVTGLPVAVGFGIKNREQARRVCRYADAVVVGSHLVSQVERATTSAKTWRASEIVQRVVNCARQFASLKVNEE